MKLPAGFKFNIGHIFIALGLLSIIMTYVIINSLVNGGKQAATPVKTERYSTAPLVVSSRFINTGEVIADSDVKLVDWPVKYMPLGDVYTKQEELVGHVAQNDIYPGQPVFKGSISAGQSDGGLMWVVPRGMRAITVGINEIKGVAGFIKPGSHVDVLATLSYGVTPMSFSATGQSSPQKEDVKVTTTVLQDVKVLAVAQQMYQDVAAPSGEKEGGKGKGVSSSSTSGGLQQPASSVTLSVTPKQAEILALAENQGDLKLVLRQQEDAEQVMLGGASDSDVVSDTTIFAKIMGFISERSLGGSSGMPMSMPAASAPVSRGSRHASAPQAATHHVTIIKGTEMSDTYVQR